VNTGDRLDDLAEEFGSQTTTGDRFEYFARKYAHLGHPVRTGLLDALYRGCVRTADDRIRLLVEGLEARDLLEESWIFVVSDHGESLTEHGIYHDHHGLYDVSTRIPLIIRPPNGGVGRRTDELVQIHDLAPTFVELTDAQPLGDIEGNSLVPLIDADGDGVWDPRAAVLADEGYCQRRSVLRTRSDKLIYAPDGVDQCRYCDRVHGESIEVYDLEADPQETTNVVLDDPDRFRRLRELDTEIRARFYAPPDGRDVEKNEMEREALDNQLEALGYR
jgi:arylsulfatase A-like enzyme